MALGAFQGLAGLGQSMGEAFNQQQQYGLALQQVLTQARAQQAAAKAQQGQLGIEQQRLNLGKYMPMGTTYNPQTGGYEYVLRNMLGGDIQRVPVPGAPMGSPEATIAQWERITGTKFADMSPDQKSMLMWMASNGRGGLPIQMTQGQDENGNPTNVLVNRLTGGSSSVQGPGQYRPQTGDWKQVWDGSKWVFQQVPRQMRPQGALGGTPQSSVPNTLLDAIVSPIASQVGLDPALIKAVIQAESGGNPGARSPKGAMGLMQLMPDTAQQMGVQNPNDPVQNVTGGATYLRQLMDQYGGDVQKALAHYNGGPGAVTNPPPETQAYVQKVMSLLGSGAPANGGGDAAPPAGSAGAPPLIAKPGKFSPDAEKTLSLMAQAQPAIEQLQQMLKGKESDNSFSSLANAWSQWAQYKMGREPSDPLYRSLIPVASLLQVLMTQPYLRGIRNMRYVEQIQQHMPRPTDTPALIADKLRVITDMLPEMKRDIAAQEAQTIQGPAAVMAGAGQQQAPYLPQGAGRALDADTAKVFLQAAGGDKDKARQMAQQQGWKF